MKWFGHVGRRNDDNIVKKIVKQNTVKSGENKSKRKCMRVIGENMRCGVNKNMVMNRKA